LMSRKWFNILALLAVAGLPISMSSCAFNQHLTSIQVVPGSATFGGIGASIQFKAIGTYDHPPETKDITAKAAWSIDSQNLVQFTSGTPGLVTAINDCGSGNVIASMQDGANDRFGTAFVTAAGVGTPVCTQALLTVIVAGSGIVTSSPVGITCPSTCNFAFPLDGSVGLSATPGAGASTVIWTWPAGTAGCSVTAALACTVVLDTNQTITATFQ
jgi:hypothetical protein